MFSRLHKRQYLISDVSPFSLIHLGFIERLKGNLRHFQMLPSTYLLVLQFFVGSSHDAWLHLVLMSLSSFRKSSNSSAVFCLFRSDCCGREYSQISFRVHR